MFGTGEACIVHAHLGNTPWTVLAEGVAGRTALSIGAVTVAISFLVLLAWIPLRQRPGVGTVANAILVGLALDVMLPLLGARGGVPERVAFVFAGIGLIAVGSGLYLNVGLGPGPRDGLMTGLSALTGRSLRLWRTIIEASALMAGFLLGGTVGFGTVAFAALIGPGVQAAVTSMPRCSRPRDGARRSSG